MITLRGLVLPFLASVLWMPAVSSLTMPGTKSEPHLKLAMDVKKPPPCGTERWDIKTLSDFGARKVNFNPENTTIEWLVAQKSPIQGRVAPKNRLSPLEYKTFRIKALVIAYKLESDRDFHIVVADPNNRNQTMAVEIPDPQCDGAKTSGHSAKYQSARSMLINMLGTPQRSLSRPSWDLYITITGVGFFDVTRGQTGSAANGIELHPVLSIDK